MTRNAALYRDGAAVRDGFEGLDPDVPIAGWYRFRLRSGGAAVGVRLLYGPPLDPDTGAEMDRSWRWMCFVNGVYADDFARYWPACGKDPITQAEHDHLAKVQQWAVAHAPGSGLDDPRRKLDSLTTPLVF